MSIWNFPLFPKQASSYAGDVDFLFIGLTVLSIFFFFAVCVVLLFLGVRYRRGAAVNRRLDSPDHPGLEMTWTIIPTIMALAVFFWSASVFFRVTQAPSDAMEIFIVGKQWMWKVQHPDGQREINEIHVPVGRAVKLTMTSQDVIHSFFIPAFRTKADVLPGKYTTQWFKATEPGEYHLFCAEYCGTEHSGMVGRVVAMEPTDYEQWLHGLASTLTPAQAGEQLFNQLGCVSCHMAGAGSRGAPLTGVYGSTVKLQTGATVQADDEYIRESIRYPNAKQVFGYGLLMPTYDNQVSEEDIMQLTAYIKSLKPTATP